MSDATEKKPARGRPFQAGDDPRRRLAGKPRGLERRARDFCGPDGEKILSFMSSVVDNDAAPLRERLQAAQFLMERAYGKPTQTSVVAVGQVDPEQAAELAGRLDATLLSDAELDALDVAAQIVARAARPALEVPVDEGNGGGGEFPCSPAIPHEAPLPSPIDALESLADEVGDYLACLMLAAPCDE